MADLATDQTITYNAIPTSIGLTKIQMAMTSGVDLILSTLAYGDGGGTTPIPDPEQTSLVNQLGSTDILGHEEDFEDNVTWYSGIIESNPDIYGTIREIGLFDDEGNLCFVGNIPDIVLPKPAEGVAINIPIQLGVKNYYSKYISIKTHIKVIEQVEGSGGYSLFDIVQKDHELNYDESMGFGLQGTYVYSTAIDQQRYGYADFIQECLKQKNDPNTVVKRITLGDNVITGYVSPNGHIFYDAPSDKDKVDAYFEQTGIAWFYGIDENYEGDEDRVFLPRNKYFFKNALTDPGKYNGSTLPSLAHDHTITMDTAGEHTHTVTIGPAGNHIHTIEIYPAGGHNHIFKGNTVRGGLPACEPLYKKFDPNVDSWGYGPFSHLKSNVVAGPNNNNVHDNDYWEFVMTPTGTISTVEDHTHQYSMGTAGSHIHDVSLATNGGHTHNSIADTKEIVKASMLGDEVCPPSTNMLLYIVVGNVRRRPAMVIEELVEEAIETIEEAVNDGKTEIEEAVNDGKTEIENASTTAIEEVNSAAEEAEVQIQEKVDEAQAFAEESERQAEISKHYADISIAGQVQADWDQTNPSQVDYIKNKPDVDWANLVYLNTEQTLTNKNISASSNTISGLNVDNFSQGSILTVLGDEVVSQDTLATSQAIWYAIKNIDILFNNLDPSLILTVLTSTNVSQDTLATSQAIWDALYSLPTANMNIVDDIKYVGEVSNSSLPTSLAVYTAIQEAFSKKDNISAGEGITIDSLKRTLVTVDSSNSNLEVESYYTGTQPELGTLAYLFTYKGESTKLQTTTTISTSNPDLTVTSYYTGNKSEEGVEVHTFTYVDNEYGTYWSENGAEVDLVNYELVVMGNPQANDTITLTYTTNSISVPAHWEDDNGASIILSNYDLQITSGTPRPGDTITLVYTTNNNNTISVNEDDIINLINYKNLKGAPNYVFQNGLASKDQLATLATVGCTNPDLTVTCSYSGTESEIGTISYSFTYSENEEHQLVWTDSSGEVDLADYDITVTGTPQEGDIITLTYETKNQTLVETDFQFTTGFSVDHELQTRTDVDSSNANLTVISSYTGTQPQVGTISHRFTYTLEEQILDTEVQIDSSPNIEVESTFTGNKPQAGTIVQEFVYSREASLKTEVEVNCSNPDLTVENTYTGTESTVGIQTYSFTYRSYIWSSGVYFSWFLNDETKIDIRDYDLEITGEPQEGDVILLTYTTTEQEDYIGWVFLKSEGEREHVNLVDYDLEIVSGTPQLNNYITVTYTTTDHSTYNWEDENSRIIDLEDYDLEIVSGTPQEGDVISLAYITTLGKTVVSVDPEGLVDVNSNQTIDGEKTFTNSFASTKDPDNSSLSIANTKFVRCSQVYQPLTTFSNGQIVLQDDTSVYVAEENIDTDTTFTFDISNLSYLNSSNYYTFEMKFTMSTVSTLTFPVNAYWQEGVAPDFSVTGNYLLVFRTMDQGSTFIGNVQGYWELPS